LLDVFHIQKLENQISVGALDVRRLTFSVEGGVM